MNPFQSILEKQRVFFDSGATRSYEFRRERIEHLLSVIEKYENDVMQSLKQDLNKPDFEGFLSEIGFIYDEIEHCLKFLHKWMKPKRVHTPLLYFPSSSYIHHEPLGQVLIIGAWNYPFQLTLAPLIGALAAGNCVVLKPSELSPATNVIIEKIMTEAFLPEHVTVVQGDGRVVVPQLLDHHRFDHIFYTGGITAGRFIAEAAAKTLTSVTLELGGKSPCIVDDDCNIDVAARRIFWGKFFNAGQSCIAPDYVLVHRSIKDQLIDRLRRCAADFFDENASESRDYSSIVNIRHFDRLVNLIEGSDILIGGESDREKLFIAPTIISATPDDAVMADEIFGPILPILTYDHLDDAITIIHQRPWPLSLYLFTNDHHTEEKILNGVVFGNGCVNDTLVHFVNSNLPFGGAGFSGMGAYHGHYSFETFSRRRSLMRTPVWPDIPIRYPPYKNKLNLIKKLFYS
ncbi:aldehyde dehydrogenase [bacterium]|nr:aldehyde dehydrogenase [bacterium]